MEKIGWGRREKGAKISVIQCRNDKNQYKITRENEMLFIVEVLLLLLLLLSYVILQKKRNKKILAIIGSQLKISAPIAAAFKVKVKGTLHIR